MTLCGVCRWAWEGQRGVLEAAPGEGEGEGAPAAEGVVWETVRVCVCACVCCVNDDIFTR